MSGSTIGGVVGGVVGFFFGNPQLGWMIGSAIGGYVDPQQIQGPRLQDAAQQTAQDGVPVPFGYGVFPCAGNIIWSGELREVKKTERQGKGGGPEVTTYSYYRSYAIGICEGEIAGLLQVKRNGKVVYDAREDNALAAAFAAALDGSGLPELIKQMIIKVRAGQSKFLDTCTVYTGSESQLPDPVIESHLGAGEVPSYRGLAYIVVEDDDLTDLRGAIPQWEFVVASAGTLNEGACDLSAVFVSGQDSMIWSSPDGHQWDGDPVDSGLTVMPTLLFSGGGRVFAMAAGEARTTTNGGITWQDCHGLAGTPRGGVYCDLTGVWVVACDTQLFSSSDGVHFNPIDGAPAVTYRTGAVRGPYILFGATNGSVVRSIDGGASFSQVFIFPTTTGVDYVEATGSRFIAMLNDGTSRAWSLTGEPGTWTTSTGAAASGAVHGAATDGQLVMSVHTGGEVTFTADGGATFQQAGNCGVSSFAGAATNNATWSNGEWFVCGDDGLVVTAPHPTGPWTVRRSGAGSSGVLEWITASAIDFSSQNAIPDAPGYFVERDGTVVTACTGTTLAVGSVTLGAIVADLCEREGLTADDYDVSQLTDLVPGYRVAGQSGADAMITPLGQAFFFDVAEWDGKLRFIKRGAGEVDTITHEDLAERDGDAVQITQVQEAELLRKVNVVAFDPDAGYNAVQQSAERRVSTINAKGEATVAMPVVIDRDRHAQIADKRLRVAWAETASYAFSLPYRFSRLTPTDVVTYFDADGTAHRLRLMSVEEDSGVLLCEAALDYQGAYTSNVSGVIHKPPLPPRGGLIGPTLVEVLNIPPLRDEDDELGVYIAAAGLLPGWSGAEVQMSADGGASNTPIAQVVAPATIGYTTTDLPAADAERPSPQSVTVYLPFAPESVDYATLLRYRNRAVIGDEVLQYQTVLDNGDGTFTLSGLVRGRYATAAVAHLSGARFVLIDTALQFVRAQQWMVGQALQVRGVSYGTSADAVMWQDFTYATAASQTEWPPALVAASRDGGGNVTVSWQGRRRLGVETAPQHSRHFTGYRVTFDDGINPPEAFDTTAESYTYNAAPDPVTITVAALNSITGPGPDSQEVTA